MDYMIRDIKAMSKKEHHWWKPHDAIQDQIDDINDVLKVTMPGSPKYGVLLDQRQKLEQIRKTKKEIRIMGLTPKDLLKTGATVLVTGGLYFFGYLLDIDSPKAMRHAERMSKMSERLSRDD